MCGKFDEPIGDLDYYHLEPDDDEVSLNLDEAMDVYNSEANKWIGDLGQVDKALDALKDVQSEKAFARVLVHLEETVKEMKERLPKGVLDTSPDDTLLIKGFLNLIKSKLPGFIFFRNSIEVYIEEIDELLKLDCFKD